MRASRLLLLPLAMAIAFLVAAALVPAAARALFVTIEPSSFELAATLGCALAALCYRPGEYVGVAWWLLSAFYALLALKNLVAGPTVHLPSLVGEAAARWRGVIILVANALGASGAIMLARVWKQAGLALPGAPAKRMAAQLAAVVVALAIVGWTTLRDLAAMPHDFEALAGAASSVGDLICFAAVAPLLLTAWAMRGGALFWPWSFLAASYTAWLFWDGALGVARQLGSASAGQRPGVEVWRVVACAFALAAGLAQRAALRARN